MEAILKCGWAVLKYLIGWFALPHRVEQITKNDLPHLKGRVDEIDLKLAKQIGFCEGRQTCPRKPKQGE